MSEEWHYSTADGEQHGPVSSNELRAAARDGVLTPDDHLWKEGLDDWIPASRVPALFQEAAPAASTPAPAAAAPAPARARKTTTRKSTGRSQAATRGGAVGGKSRASASRVGAGTDAGVPGSVIARFVAVFVDTLIVGGVAGAVSFGVLIAWLGGVVALTEPGGPAEAEVSPVKVQLVISLIQLAIGLNYYGIFLSKFGATPGKMMLGLEVVQADGRHVGYLKALGRYVVFAIVGMISLGLLHLVALFNPRRQGVHDMACGTYVVKKGTAPVTAAPGRTVRTAAPRAGRGRRRAGAR